MPSMHEALEAKYDELDAPLLPEPAPEPAAPQGEAPTDTGEAKPDRPRDETGKFIEKPKEPEKPAAREKPTPASSPHAPAAGAATGTAQLKAGAAAATAVPVAPVTTPTRPPQSWKPLERESWTKVPPEAQAAILRREREVAIALQQAAESGKAATPWNDTIRPYEATIRASGMEPAAYVGNVLQTVHALTYGPPHVKADLLANLVMQFGPDLLKPDQQDANGNPSSPLDRALVSRVQGRPMQGQSAPSMQDPRVDKLLQALEARQKEMAQSQETESMARVEEFGQKHDFFNDVREQMADILDVWSSRGKKTVTDEELEKAYNLACSMDEDVSAILNQRKKAEALRTSQEATAKAKAAASSMRSQPTAAPAVQAAGRRAVLDAKYDELDQ